MAMPVKHPSARARRNTDYRKEFVTLPAAGRQGPAPEWPLAPTGKIAEEITTRLGRADRLEAKLAAATNAQSRAAAKREVTINDDKLALARQRLAVEQKAELALWAELWTYPQAVMWEESKSERLVAQYVRNTLLGEQGDHKAAMEARYASDRLGLSPQALLRLRYQIEQTDELSDRGAQRRQRADVASAHKRASSDPRRGLRAV
jgi:hypothetical protein